MTGEYGQASTGLVRRQCIPQRRLSRVQTRVQMRRVAVGILTLLTILSVVGCRAPAKEEPVIRELVVRRDSDGESLDPAMTTAMVDYAILENIYSSLLRFKPGTFELEGDLATKWDVSSDGKEYTFELRKGVKWHEGFGEFTADDVVYTVNRTKDPAVKSKCATHFEAVQEVVALDKYKVKFVLKHPDPSFLYRVAVARPFGGLMVNKAAVEKFGADYGTNPIGTGPFVFKEWVRRERLVLEANPEYYGGKPGVDIVKFVTIPDEAAAALAVENGSVQISELTDPDALKRYREHPDIAAYKGPRCSIHMLMLNPKVKPLDDVRVRQALMYGINRQEIVDSHLGGFATVAVSPIHPAMPGFTSDVPQYAYDPEKAKTLLREAGYPNGLKLAAVLFPYSGWPRLMELIQAQLRQVGIDLDIQVLERGTYVAARSKDTTPIILFGQSTPPDPMAAFDLFDSANVPPGGLNLMRYSGVDSQLAALRAEVDAARRNQLMAEMQKKIMEEVPCIPLYHPDWTFIARKSVQGFVVEPFGGFWLQGISLK